MRNKRILALLLAAIMSFSWLMPAAAAEMEQIPDDGRTIKIFTTQDFLKFADNCRLDSYSYGLTVELARDLDLTGTDFSGIPIFCGTFQGGNHTISGFSLQTDGSVQGLFRYLTREARVENLHVEGLLQIGGSQNSIGGLAGQNAGLVKNCSFTGGISGLEKVGGIAGVNTVSGVIEDCTAAGSLTGSHFLGGIAGENKGVIRGCENDARINTTPQQNQVSLADITLDTITETENASTATDMGGIAGTSTGVIRSCTNRGDVGYNHMGYKIGGIVGSQSGTVLYCENRGNVRGRKEVGGIVGHLEPAAVIEYDEDALQILKRQLGAMSGTINQTAASVQYAGSALFGQINRMGWAAENAWDSASMLIPNGFDGPVLPDEDTLEAAKNGLADSMWEMTSALEGVSYVAQNTVSSLSANLSMLQQQVAGMSATLGNVSQTVGASIEDVSDQDTPRDLTGKLEGCTNRGNVHADLNVGGIAGAMALASDLESTSHLETIGEMSLNFTSKIRCVILNCENSGEIYGNKQNVGGVVGWQTVGLIRQSGNSGAVGSDTVDYAGGIAGRSSGYIRSCSVKCVLRGDTCVGGIAGSGTIASECLSIVELHGGREKAGAVMGISEPTDKEENPIRDNWYVSSPEDMGGIDGVSYRGKAQGQTYRDFLRRENLPDIFNTVTVRFVYEDGEERIRSVKPGEPLTENMIPQLPPREGCEAVWQGLKETDLSSMLFDVTFHALYTSEETVIASRLQRDQRPLLLVQGSFPQGAAVEMKESREAPVLSDGMTLTGCWELEITGQREVREGRLLLPENPAGSWQVLVRLADGTWQERSNEPRESYLAFPLDGSETAIALAAGAEPVWHWYALGGLGAAAVVFLVLKKRAAKARKNGGSQIPEQNQDK